MERDKGKIVPWIFHRGGKPIKAFRKAWDRACTKAGFPDLIPHDMRRSAVRNLERAGVPQSTAMKMVGHKTLSIYKRYAIVDEAMPNEGAAKVAAYHDAVKALAPAPKVINMDTTTKAKAKRTAKSSKVRGK